MKIAHFTKILSAGSKTNTLRVGGSESSVINLAKAQTKKHDVIILNSNKVSHFKVKNINFFHLKFNLINIFFNNPFLNLIKSFGKPNIIIIHEIYNFNILPLIIFSKIMNIKIFICPRGTLSPVALEINKFRKFFYHKFFFKYIVKLTNGFIALNNGEKNHIKKIFKNYKIYLIPNGINKDYCIVKKIKKNYYFKNKKKLLVGYLGRYDFYIKGLDVLLNEYSIYLNKSLTKSIKLNFIGEHRKKHGYASKLILENFNKKNKNHPIILSGPYYNKKKYEELKKFDILIQPSRSEGMPNTVLEAMSVGVPIAATKETNILDLLIKSNSGWKINHNINNISNFLLKVEKMNKKKIFNYGLRGYNYSINKLDINKISNYCFLKNKIRSYKF